MCDLSPAPKIGQRQVRAPVATLLPAHERWQPSNVFTSPESLSCKCWVFASGAVSVNRVVTRAYEPPGAKMISESSKAVQRARGGAQRRARASKVS